MVHEATKTCHFCKTEHEGKLSDKGYAIKNKKDEVLIRKIELPKFAMVEKKSKWICIECYSLIYLIAESMFESKTDDV